MWGKRFNYICLFVLAAFGLLFYHNYEMLLLMVVIIIMPLISVCVTYFCKNKVFIKMKTDKTSVGKNVPIGVCFDIENKSIIPYENMKLTLEISNYFFDNEKTYEVYVPSASMSKREVTINLQGKYCGRLIINVIKLEIQDILGFVNFTINPNCSCEFYVLPEEKCEISNIKLSSSGVSDDSEVQLKKGDDVSQISQIRDYVPGDKLQNIHWKLSAKKEELQVKQFSMPYSNDVTLVIDFVLDKDNPQITDNIIELFYAVANFMVSENRVFTVAWYHSEHEELVYHRIEAKEEVDSLLLEIFYCKPVTSNSVTIDTFRKVYKGSLETVLYIHDISNRLVDGEDMKISIGKAVLTCLS